MPDTLVTLGPITFQNFEIPSNVPFGGNQMLVIHKIIGGERVIDTMGADAAPITFSGRFRGANASDRADQLDLLRQQGQILPFSWGNKTRQVVIKTFTASYERFYEIPYEITLEVQSGEVVSSVNATTPIGNQVSGDLGTASGLLSSVQSSVSGLFSNMAPYLATALGGVSQAGTLLAALGPLGGIASSKTAVMLTSLQSAQTGIQGAIQIGDGNILNGAGSIGGVLPGNPSGSAAALPAQIAAMQAVSNLTVARGLVGRSTTNTQNAGAAS